MLELQKHGPARPRTHSPRATPSPRTPSAASSKLNNDSLQGNRKRFEGKQHPDRDGPFRHIADTVEALQARDSPVISVDTKKKELVENYLNCGKEWTPKGEHVEVEAYDFIDANLGKAIPYGISTTPPILAGSTSAPITTPRSSP